MKVSSLETRKGIKAEPEGTAKKHGYFSDTKLGSKWFLSVYYKHSTEFHKLNEQTSPRQ